jgi:hypothetical protein
VRFCASERVRAFLCSRVGACVRACAHIMRVYVRACVLKCMRAYVWRNGRKKSTHKKIHALTGAESRKRIGDGKESETEMEGQHKGGEGGAQSESQARMTSRARTGARRGGGRAPRRRRAAGRRRRGGRIGRRRPRAGGSTRQPRRAPPPAAAAAAAAVPSPAGISATGDSLCHLRRESPQPGMTQSELADVEG